MARIRKTRPGVEQLEPIVVPDGTPTMPHIALVTPIIPTQAQRQAPAPGPVNSGVPPGVPAPTMLTTITDGFHQFQVEISNMAKIVGAAVQDNILRPMTDVLIFSPSDPPEIRGSVAPLPIDPLDDVAGLEPIAILDDSMPVA